MSYRKKGSAARRSCGRIYQVRYRRRNTSPVPLIAAAAMGLVLYCVGGFTVLLCCGCFVALLLWCLRG